MKKALISPNESPIKHIVSWVLNPTSQTYTPVYENYPNSCRVAEVENTPFQVASPLFWVDCADNVVADRFYYDTTNGSIIAIVDAPYPTV